MGSSWNLIFFSLHRFSIFAAAVTTEFSLVYQSPNIAAKKKKIKGEELFIVIARRAARDAAERSSAGWRITSGCLRVCFFVYFSFLRASLPQRQTELRLFVNLHRLVQRPSVEHFKESISAKWYLKKKKR